MDEYFCWLSYMMIWRLYSQIHLSGEMIRKGQEEGGKQNEDGASSPMMNQSTSTGKHLGHNWWSFVWWIWKEEGKIGNEWKAQIIEKWEICLQCIISGRRYQNIPHDCVPLALKIFRIDWIETLECFHSSIFVTNLEIQQKHCSLKIQMLRKNSRATAPVIQQWLNPLTTPLWLSMYLHIQEQWPIWTSLSMKDDQHWHKTMRL